MSNNHNPAEDGFVPNEFLSLADISQAQLNRYGLTKVGYTINETIELGVFGSRTQFYRCVKQGQIRLTKRGDRSIVLAPDIVAYLASLEKTSEAANG